jgi:hypothetical protein
MVMKRFFSLSIFVVSAFLFFSVVSAETITFDYATASNGQTSTNGHYTWTVPASVTLLTVHLQGAGGGGGSYCGDGGGAGGYARLLMPVTPGQSFLVKVGRGGAGGPGGSGGASIPNLPGSSGGHSEFGGAIAYGGNGGYSVGSSSYAESGRGGSFSITGYETGALTDIGDSGTKSPRCAGENGYQGGDGGVAFNQPNTNGLGAIYTVRVPTSGIKGSGGGGDAVVASFTYGPGGAGGDGYVRITYNQQLPSCTDGIQNGGETGIDCGGACAACIVPPTPSACPLNQTLFRLYQGGNSHVANASTNEASVAVCYTEVFGSEYTGSHPHACTPGNTNVLFWGTGSSNAHVATTTSSTYTTPYCYGTLACSVQTGTSCAGTSERIVARLAGGTAQNTNLHIGNASFSGYTRLLCCSSGPSVPLSNLVWTNRVGQTITDAYRNEFVNLSVSSTLGNGQTITFTVKERDAGLDDTIIELAGIVQNGRVSVGFPLNDTLIARGMDGDEGASELTFYATASSGGTTITSGNLPVSLQSGGGPYLLYGNITGVYHGQVYLNTTAVLFNHTFSRAGGLRTNWSIIEDGFTSTSDSFWHNFTTAGQKTILLQVSNGNGGFGTVQIGVLVITNTSTGELMTFIDYPRYNHVVKTGRNRNTTVVLQANTSFALKESSTTCGQLRCLGGFCPSKTNNTDPACGGTTRSIIPTPTPGMNELMFEWEVMQDRNWYPLGTSGRMSGLFTKSAFFAERDYSSGVNDKSVRVTANFTGGGVSLQKSFVRQFTLGKCIANGEQFILTDTQGQFIRVVSTVRGGSVTTGAPFLSTACRGEDDAIGTADDCVPPGHHCDPEGGRPTITDGTTIPPVFCDDYMTQASCERATIAIPLSALCPGKTQTASCYWSSTTNKCGTRYEVSTLDGSRTDVCTEIFSSSSDCVDGLKDVTISADFNLEGSPHLCQAFENACADRADTLVCGRPAFELPFFGFWQMILGLVGIVLLSLLRKNSHWRIITKRKI